MLFKQVPDAVTVGRHSCQSRCQTSTWVIGKLRVFPESLNNTRPEKQSKVFRDDLAPRVL